MSNIPVLRTELTTDPEARGYSGMSDAAALADLQTKRKDAAANPSAIYDYLVRTEFRNSTLYGRVGIIASLQPDPTTGDFGNAPMGNAGAAVAIDWRMVAAAKALIRLTGEDGGALTVPLTTTELNNLLSEMNLANANVMQASDVDALLALSQNQMSRAEELGLGRLREIDITDSRAPE